MCLSLAFIKGQPMRYLKGDINRLKNLTAVLDKLGRADFT